MATVRFYLRSKKTDPTALMGRLYYNGKEFIFSTGYSVSPKNWNQKAQRVTVRERAADDINTTLQQKAAEILKIHDDLKREGKLSKEYISRLINGGSQKADTMYAHIEKCISARERLNKKDRNGGDRTLSKYRVTFNRLKYFGKEKYRRDIDFSDIDLDFYNDYTSWLRAIPLAENTVGKDVQTLKRFLNTATIQGINTKFIYKSVEFKTPKKVKKHIYLNENEVNILFDMPINGHLEKVRDLFIIGCRTGLRVSDYGKCISDVVDGGLICIDETDKTGEPVYIPIHWQIRSILDKYNGLPPIISDQKLNTYIKELCKKAGFTQRVKDTREGINKPKGAGEYCEKWELVTTHTARRSCATNLYLAGFDLYFIQGILGHTNIEQTVQYLGVTRRLAAQQMTSSPYFKKP